MRFVSGRLLALGLVSSMLVSAAACSSKDEPAAVKTDDTTQKVKSVEGRAHIEGEITKMVAVAASFDAINPPFTIEIPEVGRGGLQMQEAIVDGKEKSIVWSGGRPLPVTGVCSLDVGEADVIIDQGTLVIALDGDYRTLNAGSCKFGSSVAVGDAGDGLGEPVDSYKFNLDEAAEFQTSGGATVAATGVRKYDGRRGGLGLIGNFTITTESGKKYKTKRLGLDVGFWSVTLSNGSSPTKLKAVSDIDGVLNFDA